MGLLWSRVGTESYFTSLDKSLGRVQAGVIVLEVRCEPDEFCRFVFTVPKTRQSPSQVVRRLEPCRTASGAGARG